MLLINDAPIIEACDYADLIRDVNLLRKRFEDANYDLSQKKICDLINEWEDLLLDSTDLKKIIQRGIKSVDYISSPWNVKILLGANRIVIGAHGPYIEFEPNALLYKHHVPSEAQWRTDNRYMHVKYIERRFDFEKLKDVKIYHQIRTVDYADYKPGKFYIDLLA